MASRQPVECLITVHFNSVKRRGRGAGRGRKKNEEEEGEGIENGKEGRQSMPLPTLPRGPLQTEFSGLSPRTLTPDFTSNRF